MVNSIVLIHLIFIFHIDLLASDLRNSPEDTATVNKQNVVRFFDVIVSSGIKFTHTGGEKEKRFIVESTGSGAAFLDYNNDGYLDIYIVNGSKLKDKRSKNALYKNNTDGTFTDVTEQARVGDTGWGMGVAVGDYDNDGYQDIFVTNYGPNVLYHNNGDGTFTNVTKKAGVRDDRYGAGSAFGDYDKDGFLDLYVANYVVFDPDNLPRDGKFCDWRDIEVYCGPRGLPAQSDVLYHNNGDGTFTNVSRQAGISQSTKYYGLGVMFGDFDSDGDVDIYVVNDSTPNQFYQNNGNGTFLDIALFAGVGYSEDGKEQAGMGTDFADFDNDGDMDIFVTNFSHDHNTLYQNDGGDFFSDVTFHVKLGEESLPYLAWGTNFFDYDNNGDDDIFIANGHVYPQVDFADLNTSYAQRNQLFRNDGNGMFEHVTSKAGPGMQLAKCSRGAAFGDYDNDGDVDIFVVNIDDVPTLLRNHGGNKNNWLMVKTIGRDTNRDGFGSKITVTAGNLTRIKEVKSSSSYLSQNDPRVHFGLGKESKIDSLNIKWLSGKGQTFTDLDVNQLIIVDEEEGIVEKIKFQSKKSEDVEVGQ